MKTIRKTFQPLIVVCRFESDTKDGDPIAWPEFVAANRDGMAGEQLREIRATVARGDVYRGGGGAAPGYTVKRAELEVFGMTDQPPTCPKCGHRIVEWLAGETGQKQVVRCAPCRFVYRLEGGR